MKNVTMLDALIVVLGSCTLSLFILWGAGQFAGIHIFTNPPDYLKSIANNLFSVATTGAIGSILLAQLRKQINKSSAPHYLLYVPIGTAIIIGSIIGLSKLIPPDRDQNAKTKLSVVELQKKTDYNELHTYRNDYTITSNFLNPTNQSTFQIQHTIEMSDDDTSRCEQNYSSPKGAKDSDLEVIDQCMNSVFEILENGVTKYRTSDFRTGFIGMCRGSDGLTTLLLSKWNGSATTEGSVVSVKFDPHINRFKETLVLSQGDLDFSDEETKRDYLDCRSGQDSLLTDNTFPLCNCKFEQAAGFRQLTHELFSEKIFGSQKELLDTSNRKRINDLVYDDLPIKEFCSGKKIKLSKVEGFDPEVNIYDKDLKSFLTAISSIGPQLHNDPDATYGKTKFNPFFVSRLEGDTISLTSITYSEGSESWSAALMKPYINGKWKIFHASTYGYKNIAPLELIKHLGNDKFLVKICYSSCSYQPDPSLQAIFDAKNLTVQLDAQAEFNSCR